MLNLNWMARCSRTLLASNFLRSLPFILPLAAHAQTAQIGGVTAGSTPFVAVASASYSGSPLSSVSFSITPLGSSVTRPLTANYSANYLGASSTATSGSVSIPIFGLYAGTGNTVNVTFTFTNGTVVGPIATSITTAAYTDSCIALSVNTSPFNTLSRPTQSGLSFDYFLLKTNCASAPEIRDADGNLRWVGTAGSAGGVADSALIDNAIYASDNSTSVNRFDITSGAKTTLANYSGVGVTATNQHNIDSGRNGMLLEVNTTSETEAVILEIDPTTGTIYNFWDMGAIISAAMTAGGDSPANFVLGTTADWFHNNSTTYNPADNTLIVSSRENFVVAVDYDPPATGQRQIHWILGDTTKAWYSYPSLAKYALTLGANTVAPIGQHGVSIDHVGNLLLFDDGLGGLTLSPAGISRNYSAARSYQINTTAMTATEVYTYTLADSAYAGGNVFSPICGSVYDVAGNYLVDFATANPVASTLSPNGASTPAGNNALIANSLLAATNQTSVILAGLGAVQGSVQNGFIMQTAAPTAACLAWNAVPLPTNVFTFNGYVSAAAVTAAPGTSGSVTVAISGLASAPSTLGVNGTPAVSGPVTYNLGGSNGSVTAQFSGVTSTSASLNLTVPTGVLASKVPYSIPVTIGSAQVGVVTLIVPLASQTITFPTIAAQKVGTTLGLSATSNSGLTVSFAASPASVCTLSGSTASFVGAGTCTITASQAGNGSYAAASVSQNVVVGSSTVTVTGATLSLTPGNGGTVTVAISGLTSAPTTLGLGGTSCVNVAGCTYNLGGSSGSIGFEFLNVTNNSALLVVFVPSTVKGSATPYAVPVTIGTTAVGTLTLTVPLASQTISFPTIAAQTVGTTLNLSATASSGLTVSFTASPASVCTVSGSTASFVGAGTCAITASQAGNGTYAAASVSQNVTVKSSAVTVTGATLSLTPNTGGVVTVAISGLTSAPTTLGLGGTSCVNVAGCAYNLGGSNGSIGFEFLNVTSNSALLVVFVPSTVKTSTTAYSIPITIGSATVGTLLLTVP